MHRSGWSCVDGSCIARENAVIARLVSTVLCPAFGRGFCVCATGLDGFREPGPNRRRGPESSGPTLGFPYSRMTARAIMALVLQSLVGLHSLRGRLPIRGSSRQDRPDDTRRLVRHGNRPQANRFAFEELHDPGVHTLWVCTGSLNLRCHLDHQRAVVGICPLSW